MTALTDFAENKVIDGFLRGQAYTPTNVYVGLLTGAPSDSAAGTEVTGGSYARFTVPCTLAAWAGTQGSGTTVASTGTGGTTSNNIAIDFPAPTADWGQATHFGIYDALSGGNLIIQSALAAPKTINNGDAAPSFGIGALTFQIDN